MNILDKIAEKEMREWLLEYFSDEDDQEYIEESSHEMLVEAINRYYDGGYKSFVTSMLWMKVQA